MEAEMPEETKVSEATVETPQVVEEKPSEEAQVAAPEPSEEEKPAQEPEKEETPEQRKERIRKEVLESEEGKAALQSEADKRALKLRQELEGEARERERRTQQERTLQEAKEKRERNQTTYRQLQALEQTKPDEWRQHMRNPEYAAIWNEGLNMTPSTVELDAAKDGGRSEGGRAMLDQLAQRLSARPEMQNLTQEELSSLDSTKFSQNLDGYVDQIVAAAQVLGKRTGAKGFEKDKADFEEEVRKNEREKIQAKYREAGVMPEELEGKASSGTLTKKRYAEMPPEERAKLSDAEIDAMYAREQGV